MIDMNFPWLRNVLASGKHVATVLQRYGPILWNKHIFYSIKHEIFYIISFLNIIYIILWSVWNEGEGGEVE